MFITVCIEFKLDTNSRRSSRIEVSAVGAGWVRAPGSGAATEVSAAGTGLWAAVVSMSFRISLVSVRLPGVVPSFRSRSLCPRLVIPLQKSLQIPQVALQVELDSEEHLSPSSSA